jgi:hypothetical protein
VCFTRTLRFFHNSPPRQNYLSCLIVTYRHYLPRLGFHGTVASQIIKKVQNLRVLSAILGNAQILHVLDSTAVDQDKRGPAWPAGRWDIISGCWTVGTADVSLLLGTNGLYEKIMEENQI